MADENTHIVCVHGICPHQEFFYTYWRATLSPFLPEIPPENYHGVWWSPFVNSAGILFAENDANESENIGDPSMKDFWAHVTEDQAELVQLNGNLFAPIGPHYVEISHRCRDDDRVYFQLKRDQIINRFIDVVKPLILAGKQVEVIAHSFGSIVAYEALNRLASDASIPDGAIHNMFSVGSGLPRRKLELENSSGEKPRVVQRWKALHARKDWFGRDPMQGHFDIDLPEYRELEPAGCFLLQGFICSHFSYFHGSNVTVNRDIFAHWIKQS